MTGINRVFPDRTTRSQALNETMRKYWFQCVLWGPSRNEQDCCYMSLGAAIADGRKTVLLVPPKVPMRSEILRLVDAVIYDWDGSTRARKELHQTLDVLKQRTHQDADARN